VIRTKWGAFLGALAAAAGHTLRISRSAARYLPGWAGAGLITWGAAMIYLPVGVIIGGGFLLAADALIPRHRGGA
jgi:hypothetical protein